MAGPPPSAWPADLVLQCKYDPLMTDVLYRTDIELDEKHKRVVNPRLLTAEGTHAVTYCARPVMVPVERKSKKRKGADEEPDEGPKFERKPACGRYIAQDTSPQSLSAWVRRFVCYRFNWEIDQVNSCAAIMWWMAWTVKMHDEMSHLRRYVEKRAEVIDELMENLNLSYGEAKTRMTSILMGKAYDNATEYEDGLWHECDRLVREVIVHDKFADECNKYYTEDLSERQLFSRCVLAKERQIMEVAMKTAQTEGYDISALIHDSMLVRRNNALAEINLAHRSAGVPEDDGPPASLLLAIQRDVAVQCNLHVKFAYKSLRPTVEDVELLLSSPRDCLTPYDAALEAYYHCGEYLRHAAEGIVMYDRTNNIWVMDEESILKSVMYLLFGPIAHRLSHKAAPGKKAVHFLKDVNAAKNMLKALCGVVPQDRDWKNRALLNGRGYLCFRNGYYDFNQATFFEGLCPEMEFLVGVRDDFRMPTPEEVAMAREFMRAPYSNEAVFNYYMIALARGLAGEVSAKQGYICIGPSNSGKSTVVGALVYAFEGVASTFDPSNMCNVSGDGDRAKNMGWIVPLEFVRIALGNEIDMYARGGRPQKLNMIQWKVLISGGLDGVPQRLLYQDATITKINATFFVHANDVPPFSTVDQAVINRTYVVTQDRCAMENPRTENEFKMIPNGERYVRTDAFKAGLRGLMFDAHVRFMQHGHPPPEQVLMSTQDRVEMTNPMEQLGELFEIWTEEIRRSFLNNAAAKAAGWAMPRQKLVDTIQKKELGMSPAAVIAELRKHGHVEQVRYSSGNVIIGIRPKIAESVGLRN